MTERALRWLGLAITAAILVAGVVWFLLLPWSTRGWVVPVAVGASLLNTLVFVLWRRLTVEGWPVRARHAADDAASGGQANAGLHTTS